jgi:Trk-type K+ transport system membrane component
MLIMLLMWIGASPASTGGGIKTSTFAVSLLNIVSLARGKSRIEVYRRKIADITIRRASATISLSFLIIGIGIFLISVFDSEMDLMSVSFECFSAFSTVGLSIGITSQLSLASKIVLIAIMFAGRVTMLTILIALIKKEKFMNYQYPVEEITIN